MTTSVALCTYNGELFLRKQLDSILAQTIHVDEIVVCDDCSTDSTQEILEEYRMKHPNIFKIHINESNLRSVKNFEKAISLCENEIIFLSDQDDLWVKEKVEEYLYFFKNNLEIDAVCSNGYAIDENDNVLDVLSIWDVIAEKKQSSIINYFEILHYVGNFSTGASMAARKRLLQECLPFPTIENFHHDEWIALIAAFKNRFAFLPKKYFFYRKHNNQQVGGVFFEKTLRKKNQILNYFDIDDQSDKSFKHYKHLLKRLSVSYKKNKVLIESSNLYKHHFSSTPKITEDLFYLYKNRMETLYPIKSYVLKLVDKLNNKRQIN